MAHLSLGHHAVVLGAPGRLFRRQQGGRDATFPHCAEQLEATGTLYGFRPKTTEAHGGRRGMVVADSDVYKTLEGLGSCWKSLGGRWAARSFKRRTSSWSVCLLGCRTATGTSTLGR